MIIGGIVAAPFTLGASIGLTVAGTVVTGIGSGTTAIAKSGDFFLGVIDLKKSDKMVKEFHGHYIAAKNAYEIVHQICQELTVDLHALESDKVKSFNVIINAITSTVEFTIDSTRIPRMAVSTGSSNALTVGKAIVSPAKLHAGTKLALAPTKAIPLTRQFMTEAVSATRYAAKFNASGFRSAAIASFRSVSAILKTAGGLLTAGGVVLDVITMYSAGKELHKKNKCKVSKNISKHIKELEELGDRLKELNRQLATNVNSVTG